MISRACDRALHVLCAAALAVACNRPSADQVRAVSSKRQQRALALGLRVLDCLERNDVACLRATTAWNDEQIAEAQAAAADQRKQLGARLSSSPQTEFWIERRGQPAADGAERWELQVRLTSIYEKDPNAVDTFLVIEKKGEQRVQSTHVMSAAIPERQPFQ